MGDDPNDPLAFIEFLPGRTAAKPRRTGLTTMLDLGIPLPHQRGILEMAAPFIDLVKLFAGSPRVYAPAYLRQKLAIYREFEVRSATGGAFVEYLLAVHGMSHARRFFAALRASGFDLVEISDQTVPLTEEQRDDLIRGAIDEGLAVVAEVGSMALDVAPETIVRQIQTGLAAGAEHILVEAAELYENGAIKTTMLELLSTNFSPDQLVFEIGGPHISGMTFSDVHDMKKFLIREFGPDVNIGNVRPEDILDVETLRVGLGGAGQLVKGTSRFAVKP